MTNYRLTAITFPSWEDANKFVNTNYESWITININGINKSEEMFPVYNQETFELIGVTVVFAKKFKKPVKEITRMDCVTLIDSLGRDWIPLKSEGIFTLQHGKNGSCFKKVQAKSWRGLRRIIKNLNLSYCAARIEYKEREWLIQHGII